MRFRACALVIGVSSLGLLRSVQAADPGVDDGLLEFLGSVDSEDKNWHDYLADTDIDQVAQHARLVPPPRPAAAPRPAPPPHPPATSNAPDADPPAAAMPPPLGRP